MDDFLKVLASDKTEKDEKMYFTMGNSSSGFFSFLPTMIHRWLNFN